MFKKFLSLALVLMLVMGMAAIAASAAQVEISENAADTPAAVGAEGAADTGADGGAETGADSKIYFDTNGTGWNNFDLIAFHIWAIDDDSFVGFDWGGKKENGTDEGNGIWSYDVASKIAPMQDGKQYCVIFYSKIAGSAAMQTYNLLMGTPCLGKTAACDGTTYENPEDSNKTAQAAFWGGGIDAATFGPELKISSIGTVVGTCCAASTSPYAMFVDFLTNTLTNARQFSGKDDQTLIDDTAKALGLGQDLIKQAIAETGVSVEWKEAASSADTKSDDKATQKGDGTKDDKAPAGTGSDDKSSDDKSSDSSSSNGSSSNGGSSSSSAGGSSSSGGSSASGSGSASQTGQETTVLYIMLGVMVAAAGVIFFARKKTRA